MRGKDIGLPDQLASDDDDDPAPPAAAPVLPLIAFEYQPMRVFMSVLLMPAARTLITTSFRDAVGTATSLRYSSFSNPPWPVRSTAFIVWGILGVMLSAQPQPWSFVSLNPAQQHVLGNQSSDGVTINNPDRLV